MKKLLPDVITCVFTNAIPVSKIYHIYNKLRFEVNICDVISCAFPNDIVVLIIYHMSNKACVDINICDLT